VYLLGWLGAAGLGLAFLPAALADLAWCPLLGSLTCGGGWFLAWALQPRRRGGPRSSSGTGKKAVGAAGAPGVLLAVGLGWWSGPAHGQKVQPEIVVLVPAATPEKQRVLVGPHLVDQLRALALPSQAPTQGVVLSSALYEGKLVNGRVEFTA